MTRIDSFEHFKSETDGYSDIYCLLFVRPESPPCLVMERVLSILCDKNAIKLFVISVDNSDFYKLIEKYSVGLLPGYLFIKEDNTLYTDYGTQAHYELNRIITRLEV